MRLTLITVISWMLSTAPLFLSNSLACTVKVLRLMCRKPEDADQLMEEMQDIKDRVGDIDGAVTFDSLDEDVDDLMKELDQPEEGDLLEDQSPALPSVPSKKPSTTTPVKSRSIPASTAEEELEAELNDL